jgi:hypothetical protein
MSALPPYPPGSTATLQPAPGCRVRDPDTLELLDPAGDLVTINGFWLRRLQCGDVVDISTGTLANAGTVSSHAHRRGHKED